MTSLQLYYLRNLLTPEAYQNRANFIFDRGIALSGSNCIEDKIHALNCFKKAERVLEDGITKFPDHSFYHPNSR